MNNGHSYSVVEHICIIWLEFCQCFLHRQIIGSTRSCDSSSEVASQKTNTQEFILV
jgi:hypothetical protein